VDRSCLESISSALVRNSMRYESTNGENLTMREHWPSKSDDMLTAELIDADVASRPDRVERLRFLDREFGSPAGMGLIGGLGALFAIQELKNSFLNGNYMATILLCQVFAEHSLGGSYAVSGDEEIMRKGFEKLIDCAKRDRLISPTLATQLHTLRKMRNPYNHPRPMMSGNDLHGRIISRRADPQEVAADDAREAIRIVVDFLREGCPSWRPPQQSQP
jgi:hypothetical protein